MRPRASIADSASSRSRRMRTESRVAKAMSSTAAPANAATVTTQYPDYAPGETVVITGSGWEPGETVVLTLHEDPILCPDQIFLAVRAHTEY